MFVSLIILLLVVLLLIRMELIAVGNSEAISAVTETLVKAKNEIVDRIDALEEAVANGEDLTQPIADLVAAADALDAIVPDAVEPDVDPGFTNPNDVDPGYTNPNG